MATITIRGREFRWSADPNPCPLDGSRAYVLERVRDGKKWHTLRNKPRPEMMFLVSEDGFRGPKTLDRVWLTDKNGVLEVASQ